ncbi:MAG: CRISPR-associated endonuclease Cas2 [Microgenomates group bacterium]
MKKLLRTSDKILSSLALIGDLMMEGYVRSHGFGWNRTWSDALSIKNSTFRRQMQRFLKTGDIEKIFDKNGNAYFKLTSPGREKFERLYPLAKLSSRPWDGRWRLVIFDIEEQNKRTRNLLRRKLVSLGFGKLQESVYATPLDVLVDLKEFLKNEGLFGKVLVLEAKELFGFSAKTIANYLWRLEKLNKEYEDLIGEIKSTGKDEKDREKLKKRYFDILLKDPLLPKELLPDDWVGQEARELLFRLKSG